MFGATAAVITPHTSSQTSFLRALSPSTPTVLFPAMNTLMYMHPLTAKQLAIARHELGYEVVGPISKLLACGDLGECS